MSTGKDYTIRIDNFEESKFVRVVVGGVWGFSDSVSDATLFHFSDAQSWVDEDRHFNYQFRVIHVREFFGTIIQKAKSL